MHEHDQHELEEVSEAGTVSLDIHPVKRENGIIDLNNKVCPVSGKEVNGKNFFEYNGVSYGLCCNMCERDFAKTPEKFGLSPEVIEAALAHPQS
jgi:YHS domain-containing protein